MGWTAETKKVPLRFLSAPCNLYGSQDNLQRKKAKRMSADLTSENANVRGNLIAPLQNIVPTHLLHTTIQRVLVGAGLLSLIGRSYGLAGLRTLLESWLREQSGTEALVRFPVTG